MFVAWINSEIYNPTVFIAGSLNPICKNIFVFAFMKPTTFRIGRTAFDFFPIKRNIIGIILKVIRTTRATRTIIIVIFIFQWLLAVFFSVSIDIFSKYIRIEQCFLMRNSFLHLLIVSTCFYMSCIHKYFCRIYKSKAVALFKDMLKYLLKDIRILKTPSIILSKSRKVRNCFIKFQT